MVFNIGVPIFTDFALIVINMRSVTVMGVSGNGKIMV
jgi:hypothetical protein